MSRNYSNIASVYSLVTELDSANLKPIYFLFGDDFFTISSAVKVIEKKVAPLISSDFDREIVSVDKKSNLSEIIDLAYTFPFGSEKKLLVVKNFENFSNKKQLAEYATNPSESTILILANFGSISSLKSEPYTTLISNKYIFEARELKGIELHKWVNKRCRQLDIEITNDDINILIDLVGEDKSLLDMQLQKFKSFLGEKRSITTSEIQRLSSITKEYTIFDLLNSLGKGNLESSFKVLYNLLDHNKDLIFVINMLTKYFSTISQAAELRNRDISDNDAAKILGVSKYYYINCKNAHYFMNSNRLFNAFKTLYNIDLALKTSAIEQKTLALQLLTNLINEK